jgi:hypothetical protein
LSGPIAFVIAVGPERVFEQSTAAKTLLSMFQVAAIIDLLN